MKISRIVEKSGLTRAQIARDADLSEGSLASWMAGRRNPTPESLVQLRDGLLARAKKLMELAEDIKEWS